MNDAMAKARSRVIKSSDAHEFVMSTGFLNAPVFQYTNQVTVFDRTEAVTDQHDSSLLSQLKQCLPQ